MTERIDPAAPSGDIGAPTSPANRRFPVKTENTQTLRSFQICLPVIAILLLVRSFTYVSIHPVDGRLLKPHSDPITQIDINQCDEAELLLLPDVGPRLAGRIIEQREKLGPFYELDDLRRVPGVGPKTLARMAPYLDFNCLHR